MFQISRENSLVTLWIQNKTCDLTEKSNETFLNNFPTLCTWKVIEVYLHFVGFTMVYHTNQVLTKMMQRFKMHFRQLSDEFTQRVQPSVAFFNFWHFNEDVVHIGGEDGVGQLAKKGFQQWSHHIDVVPLGIVQLQKDFFASAVDLLSQRGDRRTISRHAVNAHNVQAVVFDHGATRTNDHRHAFEIRAHGTVFQRNTCNFKMSKNASRISILIPSVSTILENKFNQKSQNCEIEIVFIKKFVKLKGVSHLLAMM